MRVDFIFSNDKDVTLKHLYCKFYFARIGGLSLIKILFIVYTCLFAKILDSGLCSNVSQD